jgi:hypothetical protein
MENTRLILETLTSLFDSSFVWHVFRDSFNPDITLRDKFRIKTPTGTIYRKSFDCPEEAKAYIRTKKENRFHFINATATAAMN